MQVLWYVLWNMKYIDSCWYCPVYTTAIEIKSPQFLLHDDIFKWKHFPRYWSFVRGIHRSPVNSPHIGQWPGALMFSLICVWINDWVNSRETGDLRRYRVHYDVIVMWWELCDSCWGKCFNRVKLRLLCTLPANRQAETLSTQIIRVESQHYGVKRCSSLQLRGFAKTGWKKWDTIVRNLIISKNWQWWHLLLFL